jgi:hypothetical protein
MTPLPGHVTEPLPVGRIRAATAVALLVVSMGSTARAEGPQPVDEVWKVRAPGRLSVDVGLVLGLPATWQTGLTTGVGGGFTYGRTFAWGLRASWSTSTESSLAWTVSHDDFRLRATAALQHAVGRGTLALRVGLGPTFVYEDRVRIQGARAHLTGSDLETSSLATVPTGELEGVIGVRIAGAWALIVSGGPSLLVSDGTFHGGWTTQLGAGWQP